jgi:hypothetical protein
LVIAQSVNDKIGYTALLAELGSAPGGGANLTYVQREDTMWRYRKGISEASSPTTAWRLNGFVEDGTWATGQTSIGYSDGDDRTELTDMRNNYSSVFLRRSFSLSAAHIPDRIILRVYVDDGAIIWVNGIEVARVNMDAGAHAFNSVAATAVQEASWHEFRLVGGQSFLMSGGNMLAVHAFNRPAASSDLSIDCELFMPSVTQVEAEDDRFDSIDKYLPLASPNATPAAGYQFTQATGVYAGTTVEVNSVNSGTSYNASPHGSNVALRLFHNTNSVAPDISRVRAFEASGWLGSDFLNNGSSTQAAKFESSIAQNHSWISDDSVTNRTSYNRALRRYDYSIAQDNYLALAGVNYWFAIDPLPPVVPPILSTGYHTVAVGLSDGRHSRGGTLSFYDGPGRTKPEIVAPETAPSYSTAVVSAASALLYELANFDPALSAAMNVEAMKAILLAGATKEEFPSWSRTSTAPMDNLFGAGELNVQHSYHILKGGKQSAGLAMPVAMDGWDFSNILGATTKTYLLKVKEQTSVTQFSALVTWHRQFSANPWTNDFATQPILPNIDMRLYTSVSGSPGTLIDSSVSTIDNLEHIYRLELAPGEYLLQLNSDTSVEYGIAWRTNEEVLAPDFTLSLSGDDVQVNLDDMASGISYTIQRSTDLVNWLPIGTVTGGGPSPLLLDVGGALEPRYFYRVAWEQTP